MCFPIKIRHEWHCSLPFISYLRLSFSPTIPYLLSLLQSITLLVCSPSTSPCMSAVVLDYCTFQGAISSGQSLSHSDSLWSLELQHSRLPCPSPSPRACSNSCPSSQWCHPAISSSVIPFSSCLQSFSTSASFPMNQFFVSGGKSIGASVSASGPSNEYSGLISFRTDWFGLLAVQGTLKSLLLHHSSKTSILWCSVFFIAQLSKPYTWPLEKP